MRTRTSSPDGKSAKRLTARVILIVSVIVICVAGAAGYNWYQGSYEVRYDVIDELEKNTQGIKPAVMSRDQRHVLLIGIGDEERLLTDDYGLIIYHKRDNGKPVTRFCLINAGRKSIFYTDDVDKLVSGLRSLPADAVIHSYSKTCATPLDGYYTEEGEQLRLVHAPDEIYRAIQCACRLSEDDRTLCTCIYCH